jgi:hypothetical protein
LRPVHVVHLPTARAHDVGDTLSRVSCLLVPFDPLVDLYTMRFVMTQRRLDRARRLVEPIPSSPNVVETAVNDNDFPDVGTIWETWADASRPVAQNDLASLVHLGLVDLR